MTHIFKPHDTVRVHGDPAEEYTVCAVSRINGDLYVGDERDDGPGKWVSAESVVLVREA